MRDRSYRETRSRRRSPPPYRKSRDETRRSGSRRFEPEWSRVVSPVRRTEREYDRPDRSSNDLNIALSGDSAARGVVETTSSKFRWDSLLEAKRLGNAASLTAGRKDAASGFGGIVTERHGLSGVGPTGSSRINGGFVSPLKKNEVGLGLPMHWEHEHQQQHVGYGASDSQPDAPSSSSFGGSLGFSRSVGIGADGYQMPNPNTVEVCNKYCFIQDMNTNRDLSYSEMRKKSDFVSLSNNGEFRNTTGFRQPSVVDKIDGALGSHGDPLRKGAPWEEESEHFIAPKCPSRHCDELLGCRNENPEHATYGYQDSEYLRLRGYEKDGYTSHYQGSWKGLPVLDGLDHDQYTYKQGGVSDDGRRETEKLTMHDLDMEMLESKYSDNRDQNQIWTDFETELPYSRRRYVYEHDTFEDEDYASFDEGIMREQLDKRLESPYSPVPAERSSRKRRMVIGESIKKRLRPARAIPLPNSSVSSRTNVHARLGPRIVPTEDPYSAAKYVKSNKLNRNLCEFSRAAPCSDPSDVKEKVKHTKRSKTKPPEDSKEFKQLVQIAFFKFVKVLNENSSQRRKYIDQGGVDTLRCTLCGSKSKEFANTHSLGMHAFNSTKAQHRAEHLGFHKALCVLLGWSDKADSDGLWVQQMLPAAEALNLKNDLIMWPPVVLIHNGSVSHSDPDKRVIVSIERLEAILIGMGFGGGKTKVSRGKPANYSILVVTFNATFSGLQEAERLHKFYADNKHGRDDFQQIDNGSGPGNSDEETQCIPENEGSFLYGYLGNAGDLDKLDFESKKHTVVKSKKEIQAIADDTLRAD